MVPSATLCTFFAAILIPQVSAHGTITQIAGANGVNAAGFGIIASTPRDGGLPIPFEQDTSVIRDQEIAFGKTGVCGRTRAGGNNNVAQQLAAASMAGLPTANANGLVTMTLHQVNQDGAGPFNCDVSGNGENTFSGADVTTQVPGIRGLSLSVATDFPLVVQLPVGLNCSAGPNGNACIVRCRNEAVAGPFGSCVAFSAPSTSTTASNSSLSAQDSAIATQTVTATGSTELNRVKGGNRVGAKRVLYSRVAGPLAGYWI